MANLIFDDNRAKVSGGVSNTDSEKVMPLKVDNATGRLLVSTAGMSITQYTEGATDSGSGTGTLMLGADGSNYQALKVNSDGELKINLETADIEIGAVEIKDHDGSDRVEVTASNAMKVDGSGVTQPVSATDLDVRDIDKAQDDIVIYANTVKDASGTDYVPLVDSDGHLQVDILSGAAGGTQYSEDASHSSGDTGTMSLAVRQDDIDKLTSADGDYAPFKTNRHGSLYTDPQAFFIIDKMDAATGWSVLGNDTTNLATSTNHVCGTNSLEFDKVDGADNTVFAGIEKTLTSFKAGPYLKAGGFVLYSLYVSSTTEIDYAFVRLGTDSSNYNEWRVSGDILVTGWNNIRMPILSPEASGITGSGWDCSAVTYGAVGVAFDAQNDTLADIRVDKLTLNAGMQTSADITAQVSSEVSSPNVRVQKWGNDNVDTNTGNVGDGTLRVTIADDDTNQSAIKTAVETLDNAVSGSEMQVDIVADGAGLMTSSDFTTVLGSSDLTSATPALKVEEQGTVTVTDNGSFTLAANDGVDIGDVDVASIAAGSNTVGKVYLTDGTEDVAVNTNNRLEISIEEDNAGVGRDETITETTASQDLSVAALSTTTSIGADFRVNYVLLHASTAITESVDVSVDANAGANFDTVLVSEDLSAATDFMWIPDNNLDFASGNEIIVECTNNNTTGTVYLTVATENR